MLRAGPKLWAVLATHGHFDQVAGIPKIAGLGGTYILRDDVSTLKMSMEWFFRYLDGEAALPVFDVLLEGSEELSLGSTEMSIIHTPGHSPGSVSIYVPSAGICSPVTLSSPVPWAGQTHRVGPTGGSR